MRASCSNPLDRAMLADYWLGTSSSEDEERVETHLLSCDACGDALRETIALSQGLHALTRSGALRVVVSEELVKRAGEGGLRVREYAPPRGGSVQCTVTAEDDWLVAHLDVEPADAQRIDLTFSDEEGHELQRMADIPVRPDARRVSYQESITFAKASPTMTMVARLVAVEAGGERVLGEYTFHHTRTLPGPGGLELH